jgi:hypothetical protein
MITVFASDDIFRPELIDAQKFELNPKELGHLLAQAGNEEIAKFLIGLSISWNNHSCEADAKNAANYISNSYKDDKKLVISTLTQILKALKAKK